MTPGEAYIVLGRWLGWAGWALVVAGLIGWNAWHPFVDESLVLLCWPLLAGVTVRPVVKFLWPLWVFLAIAEGIWPHMAVWAAVMEGLRTIGAA